MGRTGAVVALPDTQFSSEKYPKIWEAQIDWIVANRKDLNIADVVHLGDITQNGDGKPEEWLPLYLFVGVNEPKISPAWAESLPVV